jgi:hypothetical protein
MKQMLHILVFIPLFTLTSSAQSDDEFKAKVQQVHRSFFAAILAEDYKLVEQILSDDVTFGSPDGNFAPKLTYVENLKSGILFYDSVTEVSSQTRSYGNTGVVNGTADLIYRFKNRDGTMPENPVHLTYTAVYVMDNRSIRMVAWQATLRQAKN